MDAIIQSPVTRESELTAIARLVIYAQAAARDLGAKEVDCRLAETLDAIIRELDGSSDDGGLPVVPSARQALATRQ